MINNKELIKELKSSKVTEKEIKELLPIANKLNKLNTLERSYSFKRKFLEEEPDYKPLRVPRWFFAPAIAFVLLFLIGSTIAKAQTSLPGEPLYAIKKATEKIYSTVNPSFKEEIPVRRSEEVKKLTEEKKDSMQVKKTIKEYVKEKNKVKEHNKDKVESARKNLEKAKEKAPEEIKKEIDKAIKEDQENVKGAEDKREENKQNNGVGQKK